MVKSESSKIAQNVPGRGDRLELNCPKGIDIVKEQVSPDIRTYKAALAAGAMVLTKKGSFSYLQDDVNYLQIDSALSIRIERITSDVARVYIANAKNVQQPVPPHITMAHSAGAPVLPFRENFLITWFGSFVLSINGQPHMMLNNKKQQSITGPSYAASGVV